MARLNVTGLDETIEQMKRMGQLTGQVADAMILTGAEVIREHWVASAQSHGHVDTGDMIASIRYAKQPKDVGGMRILDVYPQGKDEKDVRNAEKAFVLNYGSSSIKASHWVKEANESGESPAGLAMIRIWDEFIKTGRVPAVAAPKYMKRVKKKRRT